MFKVPNNFRVLTGPLASTDREGRYGAFLIPSASRTGMLEIIASAGDDPTLAGFGWEHVSAKYSEGPKRVKTPNWQEMCQVKAAFWDDDDVVMQLHPAKSAYVNVHFAVLHLWRPTQQQIPLPPIVLV